MRIMALGKSLDDRLLYPPLDQEKFAERLSDDLSRIGRTLRNDRGILGSVSFTEARPPSLNYRDPQQAGWTYVVAANDRRREEYIAAIEPLAELRGMVNPDKPWVFDTTREDEWLDWINNNYWRLDRARRPPLYVLLVGGPTKLPFRFQALFNTVAHVGRLAFDHLEELHTYVEKLIRLEKQSELTVEREVLLFAPNAGLNDPTHYSCNYMVKPLATRVSKTGDVETIELFAHDATKKNLLAALHTTRPAIVYTASHGLGLIGEPLARQRDYNGAICCQSAGGSMSDDIFSAADIPETPFLEGAVVFQFACYGFGTPGTSDYAHWLNGPTSHPVHPDFVAALPKRLLAHPRGPLAYIGHVDTAFLHAFTDPNNIRMQWRWNDRVYPFVDAVEHLLELAPAGFSLRAMSGRYSTANAYLANVYDDQRRSLEHRPHKRWTAEQLEKFVAMWIYRSDAQNYMVLGDPAARLRMPTSTAAVDASRS